MAAVLACGADAVLSHDGAAALWGLWAPRAGAIEVSVPAHVVRRTAGVVVHRRAWLRPSDRAVRGAIPVTTVVCTLVDLASRHGRDPIARRAGLSQPRTGVWLNGFKVDFYWPELGLVVETDGLRYHRTPAQQARDRLRDQAHAAAGLTPLRFTRAQVRYDPGHVETTLGAVARRLSRPGR